MSVTANKRPVAFKDLELGDVFEDLDGNVCLQVYNHQFRGSDPFDNLICNAIILQAAAYKPLHLKTDKSRWKCHTERGAPMKYSEDTFVYALDNCGVII